ncbi:MAG: hypothetical protein K2X66_10825, partial [Cyanobacteria bacterium]|nr:hypothetical protein [Cyanobacteriota bacterium]
MDIYTCSTPPHLASPAKPLLRLKHEKMRVEGSSKTSPIRHFINPASFFVTQDSLEIRFGKSKKAVEESFRDAATHGYKGALL